MVGVSTIVPLTMTGPAFRKRRQELGASQSQLAAALSVNKQTVSNWEREVYPVPETIARLLERLTKRDITRFAKRRA